MGNRSIEFFEHQFRRQAAARELALNPFETLALDHLAGRVLDLGAGLGNLSLAAAERGHRVVAVDAGIAAIDHLQSEARLRKLPIDVLRADVATWDLDRDFDTIACIGLLMFLREDRATEILRQIRSHVVPGGRAIVNVLVEGTTYAEMFEPAHHYLFGRDELREAFAGWRVLASRRDVFPAPGDTTKVFSTLVAQRPDEG